MYAAFSCCGECGMKSDHLIDKDHVGQPLYCQAEKRHLKGSDLGQETLTHLTGRLVITHQARHSRISALRDTQSVKHNHSHDHGRSNPTPGLSPHRETVLTAQRFTACCNQQGRLKPVVARQRGPTKHPVVRSSASSTFAACLEFYIQQFEHSLSTNPADT